MRFTDALGRLEAGIASLDFEPVDTALYFEPAAVAQPAPDTLLAARHRLTFDDLTLDSHLVRLQEDCMDIAGKRRFPTTLGFPIAEGPEYFWRTDVFLSESPIPDDPDEIVTTRAASFRGVLGQALFDDIDAKADRLNRVRAERERRDNEGIAVPHDPELPSREETILESLHHPITDQQLFAASDREIEDLLEHEPFPGTGVEADLRVNPESTLWELTYQTIYKVLGEVPAQYREHAVIHTEIETRESVGKKLYPALGVPPEIRVPINFPMSVTFRRPEHLLQVVGRLIGLKPDDLQVQAS